MGVRALLLINMTFPPPPPPPPAWAGINAFSSVDLAYERFILGLRMTNVNDDDDDDVVVRCTAGISWLDLGPSTQSCRTRSFQTL